VLNPKKYKQITDEVAKDMGLDKHLVEEVVQFFYSQVRKNLSKLTHPRIVLPGLGTFTVRKQKLKNQVKKNSDILNNLDPTKFNDYKVHRSVREKLERLTSMQEIISKEEEERRSFKTNKDGKTD
jgi:nucleoid DNA-binding protein